MDYYLSKYEYNEILMNKIINIRKNILADGERFFKNEKKKDISEEYYKFIEGAIKKIEDYNYQKIKFDLKKEMDTLTEKLDKEWDVIELIKNHINSIKRSKSINLK
jgi:lysyl-tRNA synthetase class I